jgi:hypothetical protein
VELTTLGKKMTDKRNLDIDDIDSFLNEDAMTSTGNTNLSEEVNLHNLKKSAPRNNSLVTRLNNRVAHANKNLTTALGNAQAQKELLSEEQESCNQLSEDMRDWENVLTNLEAVMRDLPEIHAIDAADNDDDSEVKDGEDTTNSHQEKLLHALEKKESRILELEAKLDALQSISSVFEESGERPELFQRDDSRPYVNRLIVNMNGDETLKYPLSKNIMTIGREPHNDIHIRSRYISRFHARIVSDQDGSIIEDLDSRNGVAVNANKARRQVLRSGDLIDLGRVQLKFIDLMEGSADEGSA